MPSSTEWQTVSSPVDAMLNDVVTTDRTAYAVASGGTFLVRKPPGDWTAQVKDGIAGNGQNLLSVATTDDGNRVWFAGASGAFGYYVPASKSVTDLTGPNGLTVSFTSLVVSGKAGKERIYAADANGQVLHGRANKDDVQFETTVKPNGGSGGITGLDSDEDGALVGCDTDGALLRSTDGTNWRGDDVADTQFNGVAADGRRYHAVTDSGTLYEHRFYGGDGNGQTSSEDTGADTANDVAVNRGEMLVAGTSGRVHERAADGWQTSDLEQDVEFQAVATGKLDIVVGESGVVAER